MCVMQVLKGGPNYGYAITQQLAEVGLGRVKGGTLYPLLGRLEEADFVVVEWRPGDGGPGRKYFALTEQGHQEANELSDRWTSFTAAVREFTDQAMVTDTSGRN